MMGGIGVPELLVVFGLVLVLLPGIFFCRSMQKALNRCSPENRRMRPGLVWLYFVPLFNLVWNFFIAIKVDESLQLEYAKLGMSGYRPVKGIGIAYSVLYICAVIPAIGTLAAIAGLVCWIIFWVKVASMSKGLEFSTQQVAEDLD